MKEIEELKAAGVPLWERLVYQVGGSIFLLGVVSLIIVISPFLILWSVLSDAPDDTFKKPHELADAALTRVEKHRVYLLAKYRH